MIIGKILTSITPLLTYFHTFIFKWILFFARFANNQEKILRMVLKAMPFSIYKDRLISNKTHQVTTSVEFHSVLCHKDVAHGIICLHSFLRFFPKSFLLVIHEDGSLTEEDYVLIKKYLPHTKIIKFASTQKTLLAFLKKKYPSIFRNRIRALKRWHLLTMLDSWVFAKTARIVYLDSDIFFFKAPQRIIEWIQTEEESILHCSGNPKNPYIHCLESPEEFIELYGVNPINLFNMGILCFNKKIVSLSQIDFFLSKIYSKKANEKNYRDQSFWCYIYSGNIKQKVERLPLQSYVLPHADTTPVVGEDSVTMHFISPVRQHVYRYCFDYLRGKI